MSDSSNLEIPAPITLCEGNGGLPKVVIETPWSTAEIYLHGAHLTHFQKKGEAPLLFLSGDSVFLPDKAIRGGVPIVFPWFGDREGQPAHGFARTADWLLTSKSIRPDGSVQLSLTLPAFDGIEVEFIVSVAETVVMELFVRNCGAGDYTFEACLHSYFQIGAIDRMTITGLSGVTYLDKTTSTTSTQDSAPFQITREVDRVYRDTAATVEIEDHVLRRRIRIEKSGSLSTVIWNPWIDKSQRMTDFGDDDYLQMVCVESGNVGTNKVTLPPGGHANLTVELCSEPLVDFCKID